MTDLFFNTFFKKNQDGNIALLVDTIQALLLDDTLLPDIDSDEFVADISANEIAGGGYARKTLANKSTTVDNANNRSEFDADNIDWSADSFTGARYLVFFKDTGNDATAPLIGYYDFGSNRNAPLVRPNAEGYFSHGNV